MPLKKPLELYLEDVKPKHIPKLLLQLVPFGKGGDQGEYVTLEVRVVIPSKCSPRSIVRERSVQLLVRAVEKKGGSRGGGGGGNELGYREERVHLGDSESGVTTVSRFLSHKAIRESYSDVIVIEACKGLTRINPL